MLIAQVPAESGTAVTADAPQLTAGSDAPPVSAGTRQASAPSVYQSTSQSPLPPAPAADAIDQDSIVVTAARAVPGDPLRAVNGLSFATVQAADKVVIGPAAMVYKHSVPEVVRNGLRHFLDNLQEPVVFLNYLLQIKPGKAAETLGRFTVNSTIGAAGLIDVAKNKPFRLPRHPNGFAFTLGYYGVKTGPFLFLPIIGPTTVRDMFGRWVDLLVLPVSVGKPFDRPAYSLSTVTIRALDERAESDEKIHKLRDETADPYAAMRDAYLQNRQAEIDELRGKGNKLPALPPDSHPGSPAR